MNKRQLLLLGIILLVSFACDEDIIDETPLGGSTISQQRYNMLANLKIADSSNVITSDEAINIVKITDILNGSQTKAQLKEVDDIVTLFNDNGEVVMYAVNYKNNQGYTLISASKNYYPILAQVEYGNFNDSVYSTGTSVILGEYDYVLSNIEFLPIDTINNMRKLWYPYEKRNNIPYQVTRTNEFDTFIVNTLQGWSNDENVHDFYNLYDAQNRIPSSLYSAFCATAEGVSHPDYDYMTYSFVVESIERVSYNPDNYMLTTTWDQVFPYNNSVEELDSENVPHPVGCGAVAMGQIMKYHQWPNYFVWSYMPEKLDYSITGETVLSNFLEELAQNIRKEGSNIYISNITNVKNSLTEDYDYNSGCSIVVHNPQTTKSSLANYGPVFMKGLTADEAGHAWVCDGYGYTQHRIVYELYVISTSNTLEYTTAGDPVYGEMINSGEFFHMNWGWNGLYNGWFVSNSSATSVIQGYTENRKDLVNIRPN